jgi:hypothetical protein
LKEISDKLIWKLKVFQNILDFLFLNLI